MKRITLVALSPPLLALVAPSAANAHPGHGSCRDFGAVVAAEGQAQIIADELRSVGPGSVDDHRSPRTQRR
jgi:hypothetical protein